MSRTADPTDNAIPSGFEAMGEPVCDRRKSKALAHLRDMSPDLSTEREMEIVGSVSAAIERDEPYDAVAEAQDALDLTGAYRLLAVICAADVSEK